MQKNLITWCQYIVKNIIFNQLYFVFFTLCSTVFGLSSMFLIEKLGFKPCHLCIIQRYVASFLILLCACYLLIFKLKIKNLFLTWSIFFKIIITISIMSIIGFYHVGVERKIFKPTSKCSTMSLSTDIEKIKLELDNQSSFISCDNPKRVAGVFSIAEISLAGSVGMLIIGLINLLINVRGKTKDMDYIYLGKK